jgi:hypothetical protein
MVKNHSCKSWASPEPNKIVLNAAPISKYSSSLDDALHTSIGSNSVRTYVKTYRYYSNNRSNVDFR